MAKKKATSRIFAGLFLILLGAVLVVCSKPYFSYTIEELEQVQRSGTIMNYSFDIHESRDKMVQVQMVLGQTLDIFASANENFTFLVANYTNPENATSLDEPDVTYYVLNGTLAVNTTWGPQTRTAEPGNYCLTFLARDFPSESPVHVYANVTKIWTDTYTKTVIAPERRSLIDSNYAYVGLGLGVVGGIVLIHTFCRRHRPGSRRRERTQAHQN